MIISLLKTSYPVFISNYRWLVIELILLLDHYHLTTFALFVWYLSSKLLSRITIIKT